MPDRQVVPARVLGGGDYADTTSLGSSGLASGSASAAAVAAIRYAAGSTLASSQSALPQVPVARAGPMDRQARREGPAGALLPRRLHAAGGAARRREALARGGLRHALRERIADAVVRAPFRLRSPDGIAPSAAPKGTLSNDGHAIRSPIRPHPSTAQCAAAARQEHLPAPATEARPANFPIVATDTASPLPRIGSVHR
jgi:hypothetical protein